MCCLQRALSHADSSWHLAWCHADKDWPMLGMCRPVSLGATSIPPGVCPVPILAEPCQFNMDFGAKFLVFWGSKDFWCSKDDLMTPSGSKLIFISFLTRDSWSFEILQKISRDLEIPFLSYSLKKSFHSFLLMPIWSQTTALNRHERIRALLHLFNENAEQTLIIALRSLFMTIAIQL